MFIHWGPVSLRGTEIGWSRGGERRGYGSHGSEVPVEIYDQLYREFNPVRFDPREWVAIARAAGMKYLVFTSRHHDGFSMFDTRASDYRITSPESPFRRDVFKELADACHEARLPFGPYYSQPDWHHPDAFTPDRHRHYLEYLKIQVRELSSNYGRLDIFWFDGLGQPSESYDGQGLVRIIRQAQPHILINDRTGLSEDFDTPEQRIGEFNGTRPWETCMTLCSQWAWKPNDELKSLEQCIHTLVRCAGGDGNLLLNVGPMPDGRIEPRHVERLREVGAWLITAGESIYATRGGPFRPGSWGASTHRDNRIFLHLLGDDTQLRLPAIPRRVLQSRLLGGGAIPVRQDTTGLTVSVPAALRLPIDTIIVLELDASAEGIPSMTVRR
jgi:alpha-L-fucosidase